MRLRAVFLTVFVIAACGLGYELVAGSLASYLLGDSITQFSVAIGLYLFALGVGAALSRHIERRLVERFVDIELAVALLGGTLAGVLFFAFGEGRVFRPVLYLEILAVGTLVGLEIPLLIRILEGEMSLKDLVARVLTFDYVGSLAVALLFPLFFVPRLGLVRTALVLGLVNAFVGLWSTYVFEERIARPGGLRARAGVVIVLLCAGLAFSEAATRSAESSLFQDEILYARSTPYQRIVVTGGAHGFSLWLNGALQFSSRDEYRYHEALVHPAFAVAVEARRALVLGGGDGLAVREILAHREVERVVLVDLDAGVTDLARDFPRLAELNRGALSDPRVTIVNDDAMHWLEGNRARFDVVVVDFPDPATFSVGKLYTTRFYELLQGVLAPDGVVALQATSPLHARQVVLVHRADARGGGALDPAVPRVRALVPGRLGLRPRLAARTARSRDGAPGAALARRDVGRRDVRDPARPRAGRGRGQSPRQPGPRASLRGRGERRGSEPGAARVRRGRRPTRRDVLAGGAIGAAAFALGGCGRSRRIEGRIVGASDARGHRLRSRTPLPAVTVREDVSVAIVGGGVAGLSAAWRLARAGVTGYAVLELEDLPGGTSASGANAVSRFPLGAHYLPRPTREQRALCELLAEAGIITGFDARDRAIPAEASICRDPEERLFDGGRWHEGLFPLDEAAPEDLRQFERFRALVAGFAARRDDAGRRAFAIPTAKSARDADLLALDRISAAAWFAAGGFTSPALRWYVEYACRDDFGAPLEQTSAWAALHYFASRIAVQGDEAAPLLTWPEGNGRLVDALAQPSLSRIRGGVVVHEIRPERDRVVIGWYDDVRRVAGETTAAHAVCALPRFAARRVVRGLEGETGGFVTSPWVVANLTLDEPPTSEGFPLAWDNVIRGSDSLGYVDATHQSDRRGRETVWTWYRPFPADEPAVARARVLAAPWEHWRDAVLADLAPAHHDLERHVRSIEVVRWGHGMVRPEPGFVFGEARARAATPLGRCHFAAADLGGLPLFEEAQWAGVRAAEEILAARGATFEAWA